MATKWNDSALPEGSQIIEGQGISFQEEMQADGSLSISWSKCAQKTWLAILEAVKSMIPYGYRTYDPVQRKWTIASSHLQTWEEIKRAFSDNDNLDLRLELELRSSEQALVSMIRHDYVKLPKRMKQRALFAIEALLGMIDVPMQYSMARDEFGAWSEEEKVWNYTDGRYSWSSPSEWDQKQMRRTWQEMVRAIKSAPELLEELEKETFLGWRIRFRADMLQKYDYRCYTCGQTPSNLTELHMHRVTPGKIGGEYIEDNVVVLCVQCHRRFEGLAWDDIHAAHEGKIA